MVSMILLACSGNKSIELEKGDDAGMIEYSKISGRWDVTVLLNGEKIIDNVEIPGIT